MIIGTRGSALAVAQTKTVERLLKERGVKTTRQIIKTVGDRFTDRPLHAVSGVGAFVRELDEVMLAGNIDLAVHSMKDMPTIRPKEIPTAAVLVRDSPFDVLISYDGTELDELPEGAIIGTSSLRRAAQMRRYRPDLVIQELRGNINTRLRKLREGKYDGILLARAGLERMGWVDKVQAEILNPDFFCPSPNQGTIAVSARAGTEAEKAVSSLDHPKTRIETELERLLIAELGGGCTTPVASYATFLEGGEKIRLRAEVLALDGTETVKIDELVSARTSLEKARELGAKLANSGGRELVKAALQALSEENCGC